MEMLPRDAPFSKKSRDPDLPSKNWHVLIAILATIHLFRGVWTFCQENRVLWHYFQYSGYEEPGVSIWGPPLPTVALGNLIAFAIIAAGVGLGFLKKWGWWLAGAGYMYAVVQAIFLIVMSHVRKEQYQQWGMEFDLAPYAQTIVTYSCMFCFLQLGGVLKLFDIQPAARARWKSIATQFGACVVWLVISTVLMYFILTRYGRSVPYIE